METVKDFLSVLENVDESAYFYFKQQDTGKIIPVNAVTEKNGDALISWIKERVRKKETLTIKELKLKLVQLPNFDNLQSVYFQQQEKPEDLRAYLFLYEKPQ